MKFNQSNSKTYHLNATSYNIYTAFNTLDFRDNFFFSNRYSLIPVLDATEPLQITFYLDSMILRRKAPIEWLPHITATFSSVTEGTLIQTKKRTSPVIYFWYFISLLGLIVNLVRERDFRQTALGYGAVFIFFIGMEFYHKRRLDYRFGLVLKDIRAKLHMPL